MLALEHLHANALLVVLFGGALAIVSLRAAVYLCRSALVAIDRKVIATVPSREPQSPSTRVDASKSDG